MKVADIFMGGGTTLAEGSRLGMQVYGNDLNPVAWFVVKQELANVDLDEIKRFLADIEAEVKPHIMPYYYCDGPNGEKGKWRTCPADYNKPEDLIGEYGLMMPIATFFIYDVFRVLHQFHCEFFHNA